VIFLDACAVIYRYEGSQIQADAVLDAVSAAQRADEARVLVVSQLTRLECRVKPLRDNDLRLLAIYDEFFQCVQQVALSSRVVDRATLLRARYRLKTPDALQVACALDLAAPVTLLTADKAFKSLMEPGLQVLVIDLPLQ